MSQSRKGVIECQDDGTKLPVGRPPSAAVAKLMRESVSRRTAFRKLGKRKLRQRTRRERLEAEATEFSSLIKPSDNWNFYNVFYDRIEDGDGHGYIPGDLYANALFYYTKPGDLVVAPMAGSGQIKRVLEDSALWMRPTPWHLDLRMFDLTPRGRYKHLIAPWNLLVGFPPVERPPDYVVIDPPYFAIVKHQYSRKPADIANMDLARWTRAMQQIARSCASARAKRCTVVVPNYWAADGTVVLCTEIVRAAWAAVGYPLVGNAYATRHIQQQQSGRMGNLNNSARRNRQMLSDISEVLTFARPPEPRQGRRRLRRPG